MSIFRRIFKIGQAGINKTIDGLEKPEVMLEQAIRDQQKRIGDVKKSVQSVIATERQTKALLDREQENKNIWEQKASAALQAGREDLATKALVRSEEHEQKAESLKPQWEMQRSEIENLKASIRKMEDELADLKRNKDIIIAQSKAAQAKKEIYEAKAKIGKNKTTDLIDRMKAKAERSSYEAAAAEEMANEATGDSLEKEFENLGGSAAGQSVQDKLAALKANLQ
ncbi:MAG: PspA/IM30 family protein [Deltaproteobacteria bacterium]|nr:PspA/IM30 family protein [Deltaproteobacteria bacterium]